ncbi:hypothetical protein EJ04DRAFT_118011 [Polyplosphaeria fusca]|uniref:Uncharacterized protein n=1 Tax=Polyplosphaeria fusca TaxID=682080 RepID=A0A9P4V6I4_9PLEO|nr:hypothetical protein EJ04DRAFT_118011 [Polyplosphaeria fusca]
MYYTLATHSRTYPSRSIALIHYTELASLIRISRPKSQRSHTCASTSTKLSSHPRPGTLRRACVSDPQFTQLHIDIHEPLLISTLIHYAKHASLLRISRSRTSSAPTNSHLRPSTHNANTSSLRVQSTSHAQNHTSLAPTHPHPRPPLHPPNTPLPFPSPTTPHHQPPHPPLSSSPRYAYLIPLITPSLNHLSQYSHSPTNAPPSAPMLPFFLPTFDRLDTHEAVCMTR